MLRSDYNNETIKLVREYLGLSQSAFAKEFKTSQSVLSNIEKGEKQLEDTLVNQLDSLFSEEFFKLEVITPIQKLYYRKFASTSKNLITSFEARLSLMVMTIEKLLDEISVPENKVPNIDLEDFNYDYEYLANEIRIKFGNLRGPINDIVSLLEKNGVIIHFFEFDFIKSDNHKFDGVSTYVSGVPVIFVNNKIPNSRKVFTIAHELGHLILHFDSIIPPSRDIEDEANKFASAFLAPLNEVFRIFRGFNLDKLFYLKNEWKMSAAAILYRAKEIGSIKEDWYRKCVMWISKYRKNEPYEFEVSKPTLLKKMFEIAETELNFSLLHNMGFKEMVRNDLFSVILPPKNVKLKIVLDF